MRQHCSIDAWVVQRGRYSDPSLFFLSTWRPDRPRFAPLRHCLVSEEPTGRISPSRMSGWYVIVEEGVPCLDKRRSPPLRVKRFVRQGQLRRAAFRIHSMVRPQSWNRSEEVAFCDGAEIPISNKSGLYVKIAGLSRQLAGTRWFQRARLKLQLTWLLLASDCPSSRSFSHLRADLAAF